MRMPIKKKVNRFLIKKIISYSKVIILMINYLEVKNKLLLAVKEALFRVRKKII